ncbi:sialate O-acetylesterase [Maribacter sp. 2307ULW6-5]|uniref:sialate O-acetylesterase n=1 Tax=Maribacter sp. 2307ULW6-5 TaxID=3386275 RepID=UPI0039BC99C5
MEKKKGIVFLLLSFFLTAFVNGQLRVAPQLSDHMVLQRHAPIPIWGKGRPGTMVSVQLGRGLVRTTVGKDSSWQVSLKKRRHSTTPISIRINDGKESVHLKNILVGDVWLCLGQSNMEWPLEKEIHFKEEMPHLKQHLLRFFNPTYAGKGVYNAPFSDSIVRRLRPDRFYQGRWSESNMETAAQMSAVGYFFGKAIVQREAVPVGLINLAIGGAPLEAFLSRKAMANSDLFSAKVNTSWLTNDALPKWIRERGRQNVGHLRGTHKEDDLGPNHAFKPGFAHAAGIAPLGKLPIKGVIWYQGESNAQEWDRVREYADLQRLLVRDLRSVWAQPKLPFYWVQLSSIDTLNYKSHLWPAFRDQQRRLLQDIPYGGMAVSSDVGAKDDVHPRNKKVVGQRLARWALHQTYGKKTVPSGPLPKSVRYKKGRVLIRFNHTANGLKTTNNGPLLGFSLDGEHPAKAFLHRHTVRIPSTKKPEAIFYNWQPYALGNLENSLGLPASTFTLKMK